MKKLAEYIWLDGARPTQRLRSKARVVHFEEKHKIDISDFPDWGFDGSSTLQSSGHDSDCGLKPVCFVQDPLRGKGNFLVMCEVLNGDGTVHKTNSRSELRRVLDAGGAAEEPMVGFEQEYTLFKGRTPLGWPANGYPAPQGPFYCGVGSDEVFGRLLVERHAAACLEADLMIYGINAEVMPGQWEFQIGYRGIKGESADPLTVSDHLWLARWLLYRIGEEFGIYARLDPKPVEGDWNGAGNHTNFSTKGTRSPGGMKVIEKAIESLQSTHMDHIAAYGHGIEKRLTGLHETCHYTEFKHGVANRGASIRIPRSVQEKGSGYFEDRRPCANCDPYLVCSRLIKTVCNIG